MENNISLLSILIPVYNESESIGLLYKRLDSMSAKIHCEVEFLVTTHPPPFFDGEAIVVAIFIK